MGSMSRRSLSQGSDISHVPVFLLYIVPSSMTGPVTVLASPQRCCHVMPRIVRMHCSLCPHPEQSNGFGNRALIGRSSLPRVTSLGLIWHWLFGDLSGALKAGSVIGFSEVTLCLTLRRSRPKSHHRDCQRLFLSKTSERLSGSRLFLVTL